MVEKTALLNALKNSPYLRDGQFLEQVADTVTGSNQAIYLHGHPRSGKTTLVRELARFMGLPLVEWRDKAPLPHLPDKGSPYALFWDEAHLVNELQDEVKTGIDAALAAGHYVFAAGLSAQLRTAWAEERFAHLAYQDMPPRQLLQLLKPAIKAKLQQPMLAGKVALADSVLLAFIISHPRHNLLPVVQYRATLMLELAANMVRAGRWTAPHAIVPQNFSLVTGL